MKVVYFVFVFVFVFVLWQCSTPDGSGKLERALRAAGNNRPELEKVFVFVSEIVWLDKWSDDIIDYEEVIYYFVVLHGSVANNIEPEQGV